ncbi:MAG: murein hydrolase activator EnvC family protein [Calditrichia bacterium]
MKILKIFLFVFTVGMLAQDAGPKADSAKRQLDEVRTEISTLEKQLRASQKSVTSELERIKNLDKQTTLQQKALRIIRGELTNKDREVKRLNGQIEDLSGQVGELKKIFAKQAIFSYKYQRGREYDWILGSENFNQALIRYRYFRKISEGVERLHSRLTDRQQQLTGLQENRSIELKEQKRLLREKSYETDDLKKKLSDRQRTLKNVSKNKQLLEAALSEKKRSFSRLKSLIGSLENNRESRKLNSSDLAQWNKIKGNFAGQKGKLNWPIRGSVLHGFGKIRNPKLKTVLTNNGIDIRGKKGSDVRCVFSGVVSLITYMGGFGNTVIVDHNNGYYTVYAHLNEVFVNKYQLVNAGDVIASVGDSGSLEGALLHFEIYGANKPLNPSRWLRKK